MDLELRLQGLRLRIWSLGLRISTGFRPVGTFSNSYKALLESSSYFLPEMFSDFFGNPQSGTRLCAQDFGRIGL